MRFFYQPRLHRIWLHEFQTGFDAGAVQADRFSSDRFSSHPLLLSTLRFP